MILNSKALCFFYLLCLCSFGANADFTCGELLKHNSLRHNVFKGYLKDSKEMSDQLGYPESWIYRQVGGEPDLSQPNLVGATAKSYIATRPDGSKILLKYYHSTRSLNRDLEAYLHLESVLHDPSYFRVPEVRESEVNPRVLEIEYFPGQNFKEFLETNKGNPEAAQLIRQYNTNIAHLSSSLDQEVFDPSYEASPSEIRRFIWMDDVLIRVMTPNVLVIRSSSSPTGFGLVIIDPE